MTKRIRLFSLLFISHIKAHWRLFILGIILSVVSLSLLSKITWLQKENTIGVVGNYTLGTLPMNIQNQMSVGLTKIGLGGKISPGAAKSWEINDSGKTLIFTLNTDLVWHDGKKFDSESVNYNLKNVQLSKMSPEKIKFTLKEPFAPILSILSQPLFKNGLVGLEKYKATATTFNGRFVSTIDLQNIFTGEIIKYRFYPNDLSLLVALKLGSVRQAKDVHLTGGFILDKHFSEDSKIDNNTVVVLIFNTEKKPLDEKSFRQGLTYLLPDEFTDGETAYGPVPKDSWVASPLAKKYPQNFELGKKLLDKFSSGSAKIKINLVSNRSLEETAKIIARSWQKVGISTELEITDVATPNFGAYLTYIELPIDPDQYSLWHSTQVGNVSHYYSPKIDKLLEEGRRTLDPKDRQEIYANFQKAITEDVPAAFLFYPKLYTITRR